MHFADRNGSPHEDDTLTHINVVRSVRAGGDTKTKKSRRTIAIAERANRALRRQVARVDRMRRAAGDSWQENQLVFPSQVGTELDRHNLLRDFRRVLSAAGLHGKEWTPRELRHSFVSILSDAKAPIEVISRLVGHSGTTVTETVYRH